MNRFLTSRWLHTLILLGLLAGSIGIRAHDYAWTQSLRFFAFDAYNRVKPRAPTDDVAMVDIDEVSMSKPELGQWPWSRLMLAKLVQQLNGMGARAIVFDMVFAEADRTSPTAILQRLPSLRQNADIANLLNSLPDNDRVFAQAMKDAGNVSTAFIWTENENATRRPPYLAQPIFMLREAKAMLNANISPMIGVTTNLPILAQASAGSGGFGVGAEVDGIIRHVPLLFSYRDPATKDITLYPSLALEAVRIAQGMKTVTKIRALKSEGAGPFDPPLQMKVGQYDVPLDADGRIYVYFTPQRQKQYIPAWTVIDGSADPAKIRGRIVFVGTTSAGLKDLRSTPLDQLISGTEVHMNVVEQILSGQFLERSGLMEDCEMLTIAVVGLLTILLAPFTGALSMAFFTLTMTVCIFALSWHGFATHGVLLDPVYPSLCLIILGTFSVLLTYVRTEAERVRVRQAFGFYISPDFMKELTEHPDKLRLGGETRELTVMFTDIRGFTGIAESLTPEELIQLMNDFLTPMSDLVMNNRGTIDKYMGDAMMAFWNAPLDDPDHARHACIAALKMNEALQPINDSLRTRAAGVGRTQLLLKAGIGINTGPASVGNMGSKQRFAYSAIGDTVNLASRLEGQTKYYNSSVLIGPETQKYVPDFATLELDLIQVKGKNEPIRVYGLIGDDVYIAKRNFKPWRAAHEQMIAAYQQGDFAAAEKFLVQCQANAEPRLQNFYLLYRDRLAELRARLPGAGWNGVFVATSK